MFKDRIAEYDGTMTARLQGGRRRARRADDGVGVRRASTVTYTRLHGATSNPYDLERTPGGSSGGSAASVSGGLFPLCTGGDGGGSIRIPAGFTGLFGLKSTFGRIPKGPHTEIEPLTAVLGCVSRSVRDTARWFDVCNGYDEYDPFSLPRVDGLGGRARPAGHPGPARRRLDRPRRGGRGLGACARRWRRRPTCLIKDAGLERVDVPIALPRGGLEWAMAGTASLLVGLGDLYPACESELTPEIMLAANIATNHFNVDTAKNIEAFRREIIVQMAEIFEQVDFIICATNPDVAFGAQGPMPTTIDGVDLIAEHGFEAALGNNGALTIPANTTGHPAVAIPVGTGRRAARSRCRSSGAGTPSSCCSTWPGSSSSSGRGRWWRRVRPSESTCSALDRDMSIGQFLHRTAATKPHYFRRNSAHLGARRVRRSGAEIRRYGRLL